MATTYREFSGLHLPAIEQEMLAKWKESKAFEKSVELREGATPFVFYEGPPSANGMPGIHHVISRTLKDLVCRYKTMRGYQVKRKGGWDTHGLPVELGVEKELGITKEDIGKKISVEEYNQKCREAVLRYKDKWDELTTKMGYWVDLEHPYITFENNYIESLWWILKQLYNKGLLYESVSIQPYSPAAGTGLSSHELNQPGCYRDVKDTTAVAMFKAVKNEKSQFLFDAIENYVSEPTSTVFKLNLLDIEVFFTAWTTTPWTLPSNLGLTVGPKIDYALLKASSIVDGKKITNFIVAAEKLVPSIFVRQELEAIFICDLLDSELSNLQDKFDGFQIGTGFPIEVKDGTPDIAAIKKFYQSFKSASFSKGILCSKNPIEEEIKEKFPEIIFYDFNDYYRKCRVLGFKGKALEGIHYEQLLPFEANKISNSNSFSILLDDFVTTEDGTGIVHTAPAFGADDYRVGRKYDIGILTMVDKRGRFVKGISDGVYIFDQEFVKEEYLSEKEKEADLERQKAANIVTDLKKYLSVDERIVLKLQKEGRLLKKEKYEHSYPHCWRTDKPVLYYPLDAWFIKTTALKDRMVELNKTINWKPKSTGEGRFGNWLENMVDWNLSRSRFWGTPLPVWRNIDGTNFKCIGSINELKNIGRLVDFKKLTEDLANHDDQLSYLINQFNQVHSQIHDGRQILRTSLQSKAKNLLKDGKYLDINSLKAYDLPVAILSSYLIKLPDSFDLHKPFIDDVVLIDKDELKYRVPDLIDVWFDSGAMPLAQWHFPFENMATFAQNYPANFIAEGVDQTRGWFYTLHAIGSLIKESVHEELKKNGFEVTEEKYPGLAYRTCVSNGLVLDKNGNKMSKRLGNVVNPFETIGNFGADATRWYLITNASPWDNLKFDMEGIKEVQRKFFGTLYNTYQFFALYANVDGFSFNEAYIPLSERPEIDRWILSSLNTLIKRVTQAMDDYEPTVAGRLVEVFVDEHLSNWYVRLCRRRFWKGEYEHDKICAYQTLYECLETIVRLIAPISPFFSDAIFGNLEAVTGKLQAESVHHADFPVADESVINSLLEERMQLAQDVSSLVLSLRKKVNIRVRQPLQKILVPVLNPEMKEQLLRVEDLVKAEVNVKELQYITDTEGIISKKIKPNFKTLGAKMGPKMKAAAAAISAFSQHNIAAIEKDGRFELDFDGTKAELLLSDVDITAEDIPGWSVANKASLTVALDITLTEELKQEGDAREFVNRIQNIRKDSGFDLTDRIFVNVLDGTPIKTSLIKFKNYICAEILADTLEWVPQLEHGTEIEVNGVLLNVSVNKKI